MSPAKNAAATGACAKVAPWSGAPTVVVGGGHQKQCVRIQNKEQIVLFQTSFSILFRFAPFWTARFAGQTEIDGDWMMLDDVG